MIRDLCEINCFSVALGSIHTRYADIAITALCYAAR